MKWNSHVREIPTIIYVNVENTSKILYTSNCWLRFRAREWSDAPQRLSASRRSALCWKGECFLASGELLFPGRIIQLPGGQLYVGRSANRSGSARHGGSGSRTRRPPWPKADWTKSPVNALFRANESVRAVASLYEHAILWEAQARPRAIPVLPSPRLSVH